MKIQKKYVVVLLSAVFAVASIIAGVQYSRSRAAKIDKEVSVTENNGGGKSTKAQVSDLYLNENFIYLAKDIDDDMLAQAKETIGDDEQARILYDQAQEKWGVLKGLKQLFKTAPLKGDKVDEAAKIKAEVTNQDVVTVRKMTDSLPNDEFKTTVTNILSNVNVQDTNSTNTSSSSQEQVNSAEVTSAQQQLQTVYMNGALVENPSLVNYYAARTAINALPDSSEKDALVAELIAAYEALIALGYVIN